MILRQLEHIMLSQTFTAITRSSTLQSMRCSSIFPLFTSSRGLRTFSTMITRSCKKAGFRLFFSVCQVFSTYGIRVFCVWALQNRSKRSILLYHSLLFHGEFAPSSSWSREVKRFADLTGDETCDLWLTAQKIGSKLEHYHKASSLTLAIQDGPQAGQTVPHVHIHIIPRKTGDFEKNDEIYDAIDVKEKELAEKLDLDKERKDRTLEEMNQEAEEYRALFK